MASDTTSARGYSAKSKHKTKVVAQYRNATSTAPSISELMRVSPVYTTPSITAGRPSGDKLVQTSETIATWGHPRVFVGGHDVSYYRNVPIDISLLSWTRLGNYEAIEFTLPALTIYDLPGSNDLTWLTDSASIRVDKIDGSGNASIIWLGTINAIRPGVDGLGMVISGHGLFYELQYILALPTAGGTQSIPTQDLGYTIAANLNKHRINTALCKPVSVGQYAQKDGGGEDMVSFVKSCLTMSESPSNEAWTVWIDSKSVPSIVRTNAIPGAKTVTLVAGQDGVEDSISKDTTSGTTSILGQGTTKGGFAWRNTKYPLSSATAYRFPLDDPSGGFAEGALDGQLFTYAGGTTAIGGVLKQKLVALGRRIPSASASHSSVSYMTFDSYTTVAVKAQQAAWSQKVTGVVDAKFWSRLMGQRDCTAGNYIAPLASNPATQPRLYNAYGKDVGPNPAYKATIRKNEIFQDFGDGVSLSQATVTASAIVNRDLVRPIEGDLVLTVCPQEHARWDIAPGDTLIYKQKWGANRSFIVNRVEWSLSTDPTVTINISTRDIDWSAMQAQINRIRGKALITAQKNGVVAAQTGVMSVATAPAASAGSSVNGILGLTDAVSGSYVLNTTVQDYLVPLTGAVGPLTITVPPESSVPFRVGAQVHFEMVNGTSSSVYAFLAGAGVTIDAFPGLKLAGKGAFATLVYKGSDNWLLVGALSA